jgi:hypothetical protein
MTFVVEVDEPASSTRQLFLRHHRTRPPLGTSGSALLRLASIHEEAVEADLPAEARLLRT